jgi:transcriptional regulator with XRE-family HTH domain
MNQRSPNTTDVYIGKRIRMQRLALGLSQADVGNAMGITFQQIQKYENGHNRVGAGRLQELAILFGVSAAFFFEDGPRLRKVPPTGQSATELLSRKDNLELTQAFDKIRDRRIRRHVVEFVEQLAKSY